MCCWMEVRGRSLRLEIKHSSNYNKNANYTIIAQANVSIAAWSTSARRSRKNTAYKWTTTSRNRLMHSVRPYTIVGVSVVSKTTPKARPFIYHVWVDVHPNNICEGNGPVRTRLACTMWITSTSTKATNNCEYKSLFIQFLVMWLLLEKYSRSTPDAVRHAK